MTPLMPGAGRPGGLAAMHPGGALGDAALSGFGTGRYDNPFAHGAWQGDGTMVGAHMPGAGMRLGMGQDAMNRMV